MISKHQLLLGSGLWMLICMPLSASTSSVPGDDLVGTSLQRSLTGLAKRARPGLLGVTVLDLNSGLEARVNAAHAYPMMSVFKAPVAAAVLAQVDAGQLSLTQKVTLTRADIVDGAAVPSIGAHFRGASMTFTVAQLLSAMVSQSDNTAADALVRLVGGPRVVTAFLRAHGIEGLRVDLDEAGIDQIFQGTEHDASIPAHETEQQTLARLRRGYRAYLTDPRNRATPDAAADFLKKLWQGQLLSPSSTTRLLGLMYGQALPNRLRAGLPAGLRLADKCGTSVSLEGETAAYNDIGIMTWPDGHAVIIAVFLSDSRAEKLERDALYRDITQTVASTLKHH